MSKLEIFSNYGLIGNNLELKKDINIEIDDYGKIKSLWYKEIGDSFNFSYNKSNLLVVPGLINSHVHVGDSFAKEQGFNKPLKEMVAPPRGLKHQLLNQTPQNTIKEGIKNSIFSMLSNGITFFIDFREGGIDGINTLLNVIENRLNINYLILGRYIYKDEIKKIFRLADGIGLPSYNSIYPEIKAILRKYKDKSRKMVACHIAELKRDSDQINQIFQDNIVDIFIHGTHFIENDLRLLKEKNKSLILCPRCNGYFGTGFPPINEILKLNIPIAIGTDNIMANSPDLFEELRYLYRILRVINKNINLTGKDLLKMVTLNPAKIFNIENHTGSISEGKDADFFMIELNDPNYYTTKLNLQRFYALIVGRTTSYNIKRTYVRGKLVHEKC